MGYVIILIIVLLISAFIAWRWVEGIDFMMENHPDYTGNDLFGDFDDDDKHQIGNGK